MKFWVIASGKVIKMVLKCWVPSCVKITEYPLGWVYFPEDKKYMCPWCLKSNWNGEDLIQIISKKDLPKHPEWG
jgi:hypothetical protein